MSRTAIILKFKMLWLPSEAFYGAVKLYTDINIPSLIPHEDKNFGGSLEFWILESGDVTGKRSILKQWIVLKNQLSFRLNLFKFFMIVDDNFSRLTTRMIVHDSFSVSCFGNHRPYSGQKTCCRLLSSRKIHTFANLSYGTPFSIRIFTWKELGTRCSRDFACATAGELSRTSLAVWPFER